MLQFASRESCLRASFHRFFSSPAVALSLLHFSFLLTGCSGSSGGDAFPDAGIDPEQVATAIMAEHDADGDGELSKTELKANDGLVMLRAADPNMREEYRLDSDQSDTISAAELVAKLQRCLETPRESFICTVTKGRKPLAGATVKVIPESFMGEVPSASGESDENGNCSVTGEDGVVGVVPGVYRVEITHPSVKIKAKYNDSSQLRVAVDPSNPYAQTPEYRVD